MHPNAYLNGLWRNEFLPQVFVAMNFDKKYDDRFNKIIKPAIEEKPINGVNLRAHRVDLSKTGDSILTQIADGIAHSYLILADVSCVDVGKSSGQSIRNGNVMYEVGIALACRSPEEVLLIRDDNEKILFDTSTIPHMTIDFDDKAIIKIREALEERASERKIIHDARTLKAIKRMTYDDYHLLRTLGEIPDTHSADLTENSPLGGRMMSIPTTTSLSNLMREGLVEAQNLTEVETLTYKLTPFGRAAYDHYQGVIKKRDESKENNKNNN